MSTYICPYCFQKADANLVCFQCVNSGCNRADKVRTEYNQDAPLRVGQTPGLYRTVFEMETPGYFSRLFGAKIPHDAYCPACRYKTSIRACPKCHSPFPHGVDDLSNMVIAIIGSKETGKSHYIAVLIQRIFELYEDFRWTLLAMDDATMKLYQREFYKPLYENRITINITQTATANHSVRQPLLYSLSITQGHQLKTITLAFFDTAGEDLSDKNDDTNVIDSMAKINRYIYNASGIIMLIDPLQFPEIRKKVELSGVSPQSMSEETNTGAGNVIMRTAQLIYRCQNRPQTKKIDIPLAVVFSKADLLKKKVLGPESSVFQKSRHNGYFCMDDFRNNNEHIRDWIANYDRQFIQTTAIFKDVAFFGVSALGGNPLPQEGNKNVKRLPFPTPHPIRVEDPFLWLLWKNGFIKGR